MSGAFSAAARTQNLRRMERENFDVLVVGGGIVGAGVARDAAVRGLRTALVERGDFASGTSGRTSRLVHGGLRYLRNYKIGLVRLAVRERDVLLRNAPALVHPLPFLIPAYRDRGPSGWVLRFGLWLYDFLSKDKALRRHGWLRPHEVNEREPRLSAHGLTGAGIYYDARTDDARLVLAVVQDAALAGAAIANHAAVSDLSRTDGRVDGARVVDRLEGDPIRVKARQVVNATGVWLDGLRGPRSNPTIRPTKGIHIVLPRATVGNRHALALTARRDGRVVFLLPWNELALVGTTDTDFPGSPDFVVPERSDVEYLLEAVNDAFPEAKVTAADVVSAYAGLRPLLRTSRGKSESDISREHAIFEDGDGLISVAGGKLTTHRAMAEEVVDLVAARLDRNVPAHTRNRPLGPTPHPLDDFTVMGFDERSAARLQNRFTPEQVRRYLDAPAARDRIDDALPHVWLEVDIAVHEEMALTLEDVLVRRVGMFFEAADQSLAVAPAVAERMARILGWDSLRVQRETQEYLELVSAHRRFRTHDG